MLCVCVCVCVCVRACVRACARVRACVCVKTAHFLHVFSIPFSVYQNMPHGILNILYMRVHVPQTRPFKKWPPK